MSTKSSDKVRKTDKRYRNTWRVFVVNVRHTPVNPDRRHWRLRDEPVNVGFQTYRRRMQMCRSWTVLLDVVAIEVQNVMRWLHECFFLHCRTSVWRFDDRRSIIERQSQISVQHGPDYDSLSWLALVCSLEVCDRSAPLLIISARASLCDVYAVIKHIDIPRRSYRWRCWRLDVRWGSAPVRGNRASSPCRPAEVSAVRRLPSTTGPARGSRRGCAQSGVRAGRRRSSSRPGSRPERESSRPSRSRGMRSTAVDDNSASRRRLPCRAAHQPSTTSPRRLEAPTALFVDVLSAYHISRLSYFPNSLECGGNYSARSNNKG